MYLLGIGLLILSTWYLLNLYEKFNNDSIAKEEVNQALEAVKKEAKNKNPFSPGRIREAINSYKADMAKRQSGK